MKALTFVLAAAALAVGTAAQAQQSSTAYRPYVGVGVASAGNITTDSRHTDAKIFGGVDFSNNWGVEAGYVDFSSQDIHVSSAIPNTSGTTLATKGQNERISVVGEYENFGKKPAFGARPGVWSAGLKVGF